ncbi:glycerophosphodiester phosphodiesterase [Desmospora profundinema]|uniref:Glycerophosphoryl diester phosphodiesterase n=1 Tax=Desmospora profundinema TaxID=1571184 RepID=A0ABU1IQY8_9BACL|nr:glycerophosphodiester phosphodiesterase [Desmospora profundinema]MDR6226833.1 glycerophosphoryl diester phosphodiesterase [Desmospora profundinema]
MRFSLKALLSVVTAAGLWTLLPGGTFVFAGNEKEPQVLNVAHRGASAYAPEHTIPSYKLGDRMKGDYIEIDLQMTKDGHLIAMHDETLDRTTNGTGQVKDHTLAQIKELDAGSWFNETYPQYAKKKYAGLKVPTLDEVLAHFGSDKKYYIETKAPEVYPSMEEELLRILDKHGLTTKEKLENKNVLVQSFSQASLLKMYHLNPDVPLVQLFWYDTPGSITDGELEAVKRYAIGVGPNFQRIDREYVQQVRKHGLEIHPYTVNEKADMEKLIEWGVTGMFTNHPDRLHEVLRGKK